MKRKQYRVNVGGTLVNVTEEVYLEYYRSERRMRYYEHDIKIERAIRDEEGNIIGYAPSKEDSMERLIETGRDFLDACHSPEDSVVATAMLEALRKALDTLSPGERKLIDALFYSNDGAGMTERDYSELSGIPQKTINDRKLKIFAKLKKQLI